MSLTPSLGLLRKMQITPSVADQQQLDAQYALSIDNALVPLNDYLGQSVALQFQSHIECLHCGRKTNKSFNQGYCYPCFQRLAECDTCIMSPENCHYHLDSCRDAEWADAHCMQDHYVYLANSSGLKVGITRGSQLPTRWFDQGAVQALPIFKVSTRYQAGLLENVIRTQVTDRTNWRAMLKKPEEFYDMAAERDRLLAPLAEQIQALEARFGLQAIQRLPDAEAKNISYPVLDYPLKVSSLNLDKSPHISGKLLGLKGQYMILDVGVINIRKFGGYQVEFAVL